MGDSIKAETREIKREELPRGGLADDEIEPTEEELSTLRRVADYFPTAAYFVVIVELCERFGYYGINAPLQNYISYPKEGHPTNGQPGAIGLGQQGATGLTNFFHFWVYLSPIIGAIIADGYLGRYKTIYIGCFLYMAGALMLTLTALPVSIERGHSLGGLIPSLIIIGAGTGLIKSNISPMVSEQYRKTRRFIREVRNKDGSVERVIVDPVVTIQRIFNWFYWCINIGALSPLATVFAEREVGFWLAYLLPCLIFSIGISVLVLGRNQYVRRPPEGTVLPNTFRILIIAIRERSLEATKPSVMEARGTKGKYNPNWTDHFVDEVRRGLVACKVFVAFPFYFICSSQGSNNLISQAGAMRLGGTPNDLISKLNPITLIVCIPLFDRFVFPGLRKAGIQFRPITRMTIGFFLQSLSIVYITVLQHKIYTVGEGKIEVWIQGPCYVLGAISEIFLNVTALEYAFTHAPASMKSVVTSVSLLMNAVASAIGIALTPVNKDPEILWTYTSAATGAFVAGTVFWFMFRHLNDQEDAMMDIESKGIQGLDVELPSRPKTLCARVSYLHGRNIGSS
ncbi:POT family-domain-containing protein [Peziza echinospora]|nr:POT family-domain-containing protein [Peziza echinospora]